MLGVEEQMRHVAGDLGGALLRRDQRSESMLQIDQRSFARDQRSKINTTHASDGDDGLIVLPGAERAAPIDDQPAAPSSFVHDPTTIRPEGDAWRRVKIKDQLSIVSHPGYSISYRKWEPDGVNNGLRYRLSIIFYYVFAH